MNSILANHSRQRPRNSPRGGHGGLKDLIVVTKRGYERGVGEEMVLEREDGVVGLQREVEEAMELTTEEEHMKVINLVLIVENFMIVTTNLTVPPKMLPVTYAGGQGIFGLSVDRPGTLKRDGSDPLLHA